MAAYATQPMLHKRYSLRNRDEKNTINGQNNYAKTIDANIRKCLSTA